MNQAFHLVTLPLFLTSSYQGIDGQEVSLIQDEEVSATIILPNSPSRIETYTGRLFCRHLAMIAQLKIIGHDGTGQSRLQLLYYWGGDSWDRKNEGPETTGGLYTVAYQFKSFEGN